MGYFRDFGYVDRSSSFSKKFVILLLTSPNLFLGVGDGRLQQLLFSSKQRLRRATRSHPAVSARGSTFKGVRSSRSCLGSHSGRRSTTNATRRASKQYSVSLESISGVLNRKDSVFYAPDTVFSLKKQERIIVAFVLVYTCMFSCDSSFSKKSLDLHPTLKVHF